MEQMLQDKQPCPLRSYFFLLPLSTNCNSYILSFLFNSPVLSLLWIWDPVQGSALHGSLPATASQPLAVHAHAQAHHHPELQPGKLQRGEPNPHRRVTAASISQYSPKSNRGQHHPSEHHNPYSSQQAKSVHRLHSCEAHLSLQTEHSLSRCCSSPDACGQLLLEPSGTVDLRDISGSCTVSIGRPLDEVINIKVESGSLDCKLKSISNQTWRKIMFTK